MNKKEREMLDLLKLGRDEFGYLGVKAEFEAEGTRIDEFLRLLEIARLADLKVGLKIGGCEAVRDLLEAKQIGVDFIIAPMIETKYALSKYIDAKNKVFDEDEKQDIDFLFNLETKSAYQNLDDIVRCAAEGNNLDGLVFGRVDYSLSSGISREEINSSERLLDDCKVVAEACLKYNLKYIVGGGVSTDALPLLREIRQIRLDRFETRKIIFSGDVFKDDHGDDNLTNGLLNAVKFELLWLQNKRHYYQKIHLEDDIRINMLESRWKVL